MSLRQAVTDKDHIQGPASAPIELVEYGDYQCPHCGSAHPVVKAVLAELGDRIKFVFRNFPLSKIHLQAKDAALAAEAAAVQGKFWEMHDVLFENQKRLTTTAFKEYATEIGLDLSKFEEDMHKADLLEKVESEFYSGMRSGVNATPTFFINGEKYEHAVDADLMITYISGKYL